MLARRYAALQKDSSGSNTTAASTSNAQKRVDVKVLKDFYRQRLQFSSTAVSGNGVVAINNNNDGTTSSELRATSATPIKQRNDLLMGSSSGGYGAGGNLSRTNYASSVVSNSNYGGINDRDPLNATSACAQSVAGNSNVTTQQMDRLASAKSSRIVLPKGNSTSSSTVTGTGVDSSTSTGITNAGGGGGQEPGQTSSSSSSQSTALCLNTNKLTKLDQYGNPINLGGVSGGAQVTAGDTAEEKIEILNQRLENFKYAIDERINRGTGGTSNQVPVKASVLRHLSQVRYHLDTSLKWTIGCADIGVMSDHTVHSLGSIVSSSLTLVPGEYVLTKRVQMLVRQKEKLLRQLKIEAGQIQARPGDLDHLQNGNGVGQDNVDQLNNSQNLGIDDPVEAGKSEVTSVVDMVSDCGTQVTGTDVTSHASGNYMGVTLGVGQNFGPLTTSMFGGNNPVTGATGGPVTGPGGATGGPLGGGNLQSDVANLSSLNSDLLKSSEEEQRRWFYSQCLNVKLKCNDRAKARGVLISDLYQQCREQKVPVERWPEWIQRKFGMDGGDSSPISPNRGIMGDSPMNITQTLNQIALRDQQKEMQQQQSNNLVQNQQNLNQQNLNQNQQPTSTVTQVTPTTITSGIGITNKNFISGPTGSNPPSKASNTASGFFNKSPGLNDTHRPSPTSPIPLPRCSGGNSPTGQPMQGPGATASKSSVVKSSTIIQNSNTYFQVPSSGPSNTNVTSSSTSQALTANNISSFNAQNKLLSNNFANGLASLESQLKEREDQAAAKRRASDEEAKLNKAQEEIANLAREAQKATSNQYTNGSLGGGFYNSTVGSSGAGLNLTQKIPIPSTQNQTITKTYVQGSSVNNVHTGTTTSTKESSEDVNAAQNQTNNINNNLNNFQNQQNNPSSNSNIITGSNQIGTSSFYNPSPSLMSSSSHQQQYSMFMPASRSPYGYGGFARSPTIGFAQPTYQYSSYTTTTSTNKSATTSVAKDQANTSSSNTTFTSQIPPQTVPQPTSAEKPIQQAPSYNFFGLRFPFQS